MAYSLVIRLLNEMSWLLGFKYACIYIYIYIYVCVCVCVCVCACVCVCVYTSMRIYCIFDMGQKPLFKGHNGQGVSLILF